MSRRFLFALVFCLALVLSLATPPAPAGTWQGPAGQPSTWFNTLNWNGTPMDTGALIDNGGCALIDAGAARASDLVLGSSYYGSGSLSVVGGRLSAYNLTVGMSGAGSVSHAGGSIDVGTLALGSSYGGHGTYTLGGTGSLASNGSMRIGLGGRGIFDQAGSSICAAGSLDVGGTNGGLGSYSLYDVATLRATSISVASSDSSTGTLTQDGGSTVSVTSTSSTLPYLYLAKGSNSVARFTLSDAALFSSSTQFVGYTGTAVVRHLGGTNSLGVSTLYLAYSSSATATYTLSGGSLLSGTQHLGYGGLATFTHEGGMNNLGSATLYLAGSGSPGNATYTLSGQSTLIAGGADIGSAGTAAFRQAGGVASVASLTVGPKGRFESTGGDFQTTSITNSGTVVLATPSTALSLTKLRNDGSLTLSAGTVSTGAAALTGTGSTTVAAGVRVATAYVRQAALNVAGTVVCTGSSTAGAPSLTSLSISPTGLLDLGNNPLAINYAATAASPAAAVRAYLLAARNSGAWDGPAGLTSAAAAADPFRRTALSYAEASDLNLTTFRGLAVDATTLLVDLTVYGDADLDGSVDADDFARLDRGHALHLAGWANGDFDYSGSVDQSDYLLADRSYAIQLGTLTTSLLVLRESQFGEAYVSALLASVPEPSLLSPCLFASLLVRRAKRMPIKMRTF